jgi:hypothetical protein
MVTSSISAGDVVVSFNIEDPSEDKGSKEVTEEVTDAMATNPGVPGLVGPGESVPSGQKNPLELRFSGAWEVECFKTAILTAWPEAKSPTTPMTPAGSNLPPESRLDRTVCAPESTITVPDGCNVWMVHDLRSRIGVFEGRKTV